MSCYDDYMIKTCEYCEEEFSTRDGRKRYCNHSCAATAINLRRGRKIRIPTKSHIQKYIDGEWDGTVKQGLSATVRKYLLEQAEFKCQDGRSGCGGWSGINPKSGRTTLTVDHTDGNCMNNKRENLVVMCPNCHSLTPTYGALNKGNGRSFRYVVGV